MQITYVGPVDAIHSQRLDGSEFTVARGESIEVTEDEAAFFLAAPTNWQPATAAAPTKKERA